MRTKGLNNAKFIVKVEGNKKTKKIRTIEVFDNRTQRFWTDEQISERGIEEFLNVEDLKETLNWNQNGDSSRYQFKWGQSAKEVSEGLAYVFD